MAPGVVGAPVAVVPPEVVALGVVAASVVASPVIVVAVVVASASQLKPLSMLPPRPSYASKQSGHLQPALQ